jgi:hypothetical protein
MKQMMEHLMTRLKAQIGSLATRMDVNKAEAKREREADKEELKASQEGMMSKIDKMDANQHDMGAAIRSGHEEMFKAITEACLEKKESTPEETGAVAEPQTVPEGTMDKEAIRAAMDRSRNLRLAVRCRGRLKTRTKPDGRLRQGCAATVGQPTRCFVPALRKGGLRRRQGKKCCSGKRGRGITSRSRKRERTMDNVIGGAPEVRMDEKRRRTRPECNSGIQRLSKTSGNGKRGRTKKRRLEGMEADREIIRQNLRLEIAKLMIMSFIGLREPGDCLLWKCRLPPKQKR